MQLSQLGKQEKAKHYTSCIDNIKLSKKGRLDSLLLKSPSLCVQIRARAMDLKDLEKGIGCLRCRTLSSRLSALNFFIFIINYFLLIARIK